MLTKLMKIYFVSILFLLSILNLCLAKTPEHPVGIPALETKPSVDASVPEYVILRPSDQVTFSSEIIASIEKINVKEGTEFLAGDELINMDCRIQQAELEKAIAQKKATDMAFVSANKLKQYGAISEMEVTQANSQKLINNAEVAKLKAILNKCTIKAPFNGSVADLFVHTHETVRPGDPLLKIVNTENLIFELQVPSAWLKWLKLGSEFKVKINETDEEFSAKIAKINPEINSVSQTVKIVGKINNPSANLRPGMSGQAHFLDNPKPHGYF